VTVEGDDQLQRRPRPRRRFQAHVKSKDASKALQMRTGVREIEAGREPRAPRSGHAKELRILPRGEKRARIDGANVMLEPNKATTIEMLRARGWRPMRNQIRWRRYNCKGRGNVSIEWSRENQMGRVVLRWDRDRRRPVEPPKRRG